MKSWDIPATDDGFGYQVEFLRNQIISAIEKEGMGAEPQVVENTLDTLIPENIMQGFEAWKDQKSKLEEMLITNFLDVIVRANMKPERGEDHKYLYSLATEGRCMHPAHKKSKKNPFGFVRGDEIPNLDAAYRPRMYTLDELLEDWHEIFVLDKRIEDNTELRNSYAPRCQQGHLVTPALVLTTQHRLKIVDKNGNYVEGTNISFCRTKSGPGYLFKLAEYLTGLRADGTKRESIDDYLAALSREDETYEGTKRWKKAMTLIMNAAETTHSDLVDMIRLKGYTQDEADKLRKTLGKDPDVGSFVKKRPDLDFIAEPLPEDKRGKFAEIWLPVNGNKLCLQVYHDKGKDSYTEIEGDQKSKHVEYKTDRERQILKGFTPWHWSIIRRLSPYFVDKYLNEASEAIYGPFLSLNNFKK